MAAVLCFSRSLARLLLFFFVEPFRNASEAPLCRCGHFFFFFVQVVLRVVCVTVVGGVGEMELLLHLLTNVAPFKKVRRRFYFLFFSFCG